MANIADVDVCVCVYVESVELPFTYHSAEAAKASQHLEAFPSPYIFPTELNHRARDSTFANISKHIIIVCLGMPYEYHHHQLNIYFFVRPNLIARIRILML